MIDQVELPGVTPPLPGRQKLEGVRVQMGLNLPRCPKCRKTDYSLEYLAYGERTGYRICRCGHRWPINPEGAKP